jgi:hypothetical protein
MTTRQRNSRDAPGPLRAAGSQGSVNARQSRIPLARRPHGREAFGPFGLDSTLLNSAILMPRSERPSGPFRLRACVLPAKAGIQRALQAIRPPASGSLSAEMASRRDPSLEARPAFASRREGTEPKGNPSGDADCRTALDSPPAGPQELGTRTRSRAQGTCSRRPGVRQDRLQRGALLPREQCLRSTQGRAAGMDVWTAE